MRGRASTWAWLWLPLALFVTCAGWALTSPAGSSPDDDYHLASIWCAEGIVEGRCEEVPGDPAMRLVPANVVQASDCFRYDPAVGAGCTDMVHEDATLVATDRVNDIAGLYPSGYYRVMSVLVGSDVERSVLMMRLVNAALVSILLALLMRVVPAGIRSATVVSLAVVFIPLGLFVVASTNPSGWAAAGIALFWGFALALMQRSDWRSRRTWLVVTGTMVTALMAVSSRIDAAAYLALAAVLVLVLAGWRMARAHLSSTLVVVVVGLVGLAAYLSAGTPGGGGGEATMGTADRGGGLLLTNLAYLPALFQGVVGGWALGWNDTVMPPLVPIVGVLALGALSYVGLSAMWPRKAVAASLAVLALVSVPVVFLQKEGLGVGEVVQPRYLLPLLALVMATVMAPRRAGRPLGFEAVPSYALAVGLSCSAVLAFWANAHRYLAGSGVGLFDPKVVPEWTSSTGLPLWATSAVTAVASVTFVMGVWRQFIGGTRMGRPAVTPSIAEGGSPSRAG